MKRFRGGLAFKAHRLCVSLNSRLESNNEEDKKHLLDAENKPLLGRGLDALVVLLQGDMRIQSFCYLERGAYTLLYAINKYII